MQVYKPNKSIGSKHWFDLERYNTKKRIEPQNITIKPTYTHVQYDTNVQTSYSYNRCRGSKITKINKYSQSTVEFETQANRMIYVLLQVQQVQALPNAYETDTL